MDTISRQREKKITERWKYRKKREKKKNMKEQLTSCRCPRHSLSSFRKHKRLPMGGGELRKRKLSVRSKVIAHIARLGQNKGQSFRTRKIDVIRGTGIW